MDLKKALGKKKEEEQQDDTILFDLNPDKLQNDADAAAQKGAVQSFTVPPEPAAPPQSERPPPAPLLQEASAKKSADDASEATPPVVTEQLQDLSSNLKNLVYDFRSFMSESGSPFNPNDIPTRPEAPTELGRPQESGYISANKAAAGVTETIEAPPLEVGRGVENRYISAADKMKLGRLLEPSTKGSEPLKLMNDVLKARQGTKFSKDLKSNLDASDMPALIRAVNSTDYLLHAVGRKNLLKILEVGTREGWIRPEIERLVLSVAEVLSAAGMESDDREINVNDLLRVVYFLNRLLDQEISDFLSMTPPLTRKS